MFDVSVLESVQRFFANKIPGCRFLPYQHRLRKLSLHSLLHRRQVADLVFLHSIMSGRVCLSLSPHLTVIPPSTTRGHNLKVLVPITRYVKSGQNFLSRSAVSWNKLSNSVLSLSEIQFRKATTEILNDVYLS